MHPQAPIIGILWLFFVMYSVYVVNLFKPRKDGTQRRWRVYDTVWVPLAGLTGAMLLVLWWRLRQSP